MPKPEIESEPDQLTDKQAAYMATVKNTTERFLTAFGRICPSILLTTRTKPDDLQLIGGADGAVLAAQLETFRQDPETLDIALVAECVARHEHDCDEHEAVGILYYPANGKPHAFVSLVDKGADGKLTLRGWATCTDFGGTLA